MITRRGAGVGAGGGGGGGGATATGSGITGARRSTRNCSYSRNLRSTRGRRRRWRWRRGRHLWPDRWSSSNHNILWSRGGTDLCSGNSRPGSSSGGGWASLDTRNRRLGDHWSRGRLGRDRWGRRRRRYHNSWLLPRLWNNPPGSGRRHDRTALALHAGIRSRLARYLALDRRALARRRPKAGRCAARSWRSA